MLGPNAKKYKDIINANWKIFLNEPEKRFDHIEKLPPGKLLINLFAVYVPLDKRENKIINMDVNDYYLYNFVFPIGKVIGSGDEDYKKEDMIGIPIFLTRLVDHPLWSQWDVQKNQEPQPPQPMNAPRYVRNIDITDYSWVEKQYVDPFIKMKKTDKLYYVMPHHIAMKFDRKYIPNNLNAIIDGQI